MLLDNAGCMNTSTRLYLDSGLLVGLGSSETIVCPWWRRGSRMQQEILDLWGVLEIVSRPSHCWNYALNEV